MSLAFGGKKQTILSLSGIGDIFLTCSSVSSRNYAFGFLIGKGKSKNDILLKSSNKNYEDVHVSEEMDFMIWGVCTYVIHDLKKLNSSL